MVGRLSNRPGTARTRQRLVACIVCTVAAAGAAGAETPEQRGAEPGFLAARGNDLRGPGPFAIGLDDIPTVGSSTPRLTLERSVERVGGLRPQWRPGGLSTGRLDISNRVWLGWGRAAFGLGLGAQAPRLDPPIEPLNPSARQDVRPSMSVGWRYRLTESSSFYAGASAARAWGDADALPSYGARAGIEWKAARSRLGFDGGRLGLQLDSGYRMSIRTRSGGVQVALRRAF